MVKLEGIRALEEKNKEIKRFLQLIYQSLVEAGGAVVRDGDVGFNLHGHGIPVIEATQAKTLGFSQMFVLFFRWYLHPNSIMSSTPFAHNFGHRRLLCCVLCLCPPLSQALPLTDYGLVQKVGCGPIYLSTVQENKESLGINP